MFNTQIDTHAGILHIEFPEGMRTRKVSVKVSTSEQAVHLYKTNVAKYIVATLTRWINHREWTLRYTGEMTSAREYALSKIRLMLQHHAESKLHIIIYQVHKHNLDFQLLAPGENSRYYKKYLHTIVPIRYWCFQELNKMRYPAPKGGA